MTNSNQHKSYMYRQGNGWIVAHWDEAVQCYRTSHEMPYYVARIGVGQANCRHAHDGLCRIPSHQHLEMRG